MRALLWVALLSLCACAPKKPAEAPHPVPARSRTPGDELLGFAPGGAHAILELDLGRLRKNEKLGPLLTAIETTQAIAGSDLLRVADAVLICTYGLGDKTRHVFLLRGADPAHFPGAVALSPSVAVVADDPELLAVRAVQAGTTPAMADDPVFMRLRTEAMPEAATGAVLRAAANLSFAARVDVANRLDLDAVPQAFSVWGDVVDDLAVVATLTGTSKAEAETLAHAAESLRKRLTKGKEPIALLLRGVLGGMTVKVSHNTARVVLLIGPGRLERMVKLLLEKIGAAT